MNILQPEVKLLSPIDRAYVIGLIEEIGRTCYQSKDKMTELSGPKFVSAIVKRGHLSVIEHFSVSFQFVTSRSVTHEIVRHRLASYAQESSRYVNYSKTGKNVGLNVIDISSGFKYDFSNEKDLLKYNIWHKAMENSEKSYLEMIAAGATPDEARSVLTLSTKSEINMTADLREWRHFIELRASKFAHPDIRKIAIEVYDILVRVLPEFFQDLEDVIYRD